jgi:hypothetical protein
MDRTVPARLPLTNSHGQGFPVRERKRMVPFRVYAPLQIPLIKGTRHAKGSINVKLRAKVGATMIALATPAYAGIFDYESMHMRLAAVLGSRAEANRVFDRLMQKAIETRQPIETLVDIFIELCTASDECMK